MNFEEKLEHTRASLKDEFKEKLMFITKNKGQT